VTQRGALFEVAADRWRERGEKDAHGFEEDTMNAWSEPLDFSSAQEELYSAVIADCLDEVGLRHQAMDQYIRPIDPTFALMGRAYTVLASDTQEIVDDPYEKELEAVGGLSAGDVVVATVEGSGTAALWGELLSTAATSRGSRGAVIDGLTRDSNKVVEMRFPTFVRGYSPLDSKGRIEVVAHGEPIRCGGVPVSTGDIVFGDRDGVVIVPRDAVAEVLRKAAEKVSGENEMKAALKRGVGVEEAYKRYGIL
jgi:4-hydroxy-4-methyl-2-oxoglutarate aldolase